MITAQAGATLDAAVWWTSEAGQHVDTNNGFPDRYCTALTYGARVDVCRAGRGDAAGRDAESPHRGTAVGRDAESPRGRVATNAPLRYLNDVAPPRGGATVYPCANAPAAAARAVTTRHGASKMHFLAGSIKRACS